MFPCERQPALPFWRHCSDTIIAWRRSCHCFHLPLQGACQSKKGSMGGFLLSSLCLAKLIMVEQDLSSAPPPHIHCPSSPFLQCGYSAPRSSQHHVVIEEEGELSIPERKKRKEKKRKEKKRKERRWQTPRKSFSRNDIFFVRSYPQIK